MGQALPAPAKAFFSFPLSLLFPSCGLVVPEEPMLSVTVPRATMRPEVPQLSSQTLLLPFLPGDSGQGRSLANSQQSP